MSAGVRGWSLGRGVVLWLVALAVGAAGFGCDASPRDCPKQLCARRCAGERVEIPNGCPQPLCICPEQR